MKRSAKMSKERSYEPEELEDSGFYHMVINEESLHYVFTRIKFYPKDQSKASWEKISSLPTYCIHDLLLFIIVFFLIA